MPKSSNPISAYGRRKTATARVRLGVGKGEITVNGQPVEKYFPDPVAKALYTEPFRVTNTLNKFTVTVIAQGSGKSGQLGAMVLGFARALCKFDPKFRSSLRKKGFMTRDPRARQRERFGLMGARKQKQSPKR